MKVYIPTMEELIELQKLGIDIYSYLVTKVIETIIMEDIIYDSGDMFEIINYLGEHPEIYYSICKLYPQKISTSIITSKDQNLCNKLIQGIRREDKIIYKLDDVLMNFDENILFEEDIIKNVIKFISAHISSCPKYRFDYMGPNNLLDSIFSCELQIEKIPIDSYIDLIYIDPIYLVKLGIDYKTNKDKIVLFKRSLAMYTERYGLEEFINKDYQNKDIINKPDDNVKRLIKCLEYHKKNYQ